MPGFQMTVSFMTSGEPASMRRERNICCVSTPNHKYIIDYKINKSLKRCNLFSVTNDLHSLSCFILTFSILQSPKAISPEGSQAY